MQKILTNILLAALLLGTAGCNGHRPDIQQGNVITRERVEMLKVGMAPRQVRFILGTPLLQDPFRSDRWNYHYSYRSGEGEARRYSVTLYFEEEKLARIEPEGDLPESERVVLRRIAGRGEE